MLAGPAHSGRSTLAQQLLQIMPNRLAGIPVISSSGPAGLCHMHSEAMQPSASRVGSCGSGVGSSSNAQLQALQQQWPGTQWLQFAPESTFTRLHQAQQLAGLHTHMGQSYAVQLAALQQAACDDRAGVVVGSLHLAEQLKRDLRDTQARAGS